MERSFSIELAVTSSEKPILPDFGKVLAEETAGATTNFRYRKTSAQFLLRFDATTSRQICPVLMVPDLRLKLSYLVFSGSKLPG
jgi:hypothetical protein